MNNHRRTFLRTSPLILVAFGFAIWLIVTNVASNRNAERAKPRDFRLYIGTQGMPPSDRAAFEKSAATIHREPISGPYTRYNPKTGQHELTHEGQIKNMYGR